MRFYFSFPGLLALSLAIVAYAGCASAPPSLETDTVRVSYQPDAGPVRHVIHISVDGFRPDAVTRHQPGDLPYFYRLRAQGAFTDNARTDVDYGNTLPNHTSQLTGRGVVGRKGHGWTSNQDPQPHETIHSRNGDYVASVFDVAHDHGLRTGVYASKSKFVLFDQSYDEVHGAPDTTGVDNGRDKIDTFVYDSDTENLVNRFVQDMKADPYGYSFVHLSDPDLKGHRWGWRLWRWHPYMWAVRHVDTLLGEILDMVDSDPRLAGHTAIILTSDHGGSGHTHGAVAPGDYTVPFYVWGAGVPAGDLYALNKAGLLDPEGGQPGYDAPVQPVRNGSAANLALSLLDLNPVPGSTINTSDQLRVRPQEEASGIVADGGARGDKGRQ